MWISTPGSRSRAGSLELCLPDGANRHARLQTAHLRKPEGPRAQSSPPVNSVIDDQGFVLTGRALGHEHVTGPWEAL
jgi:hypothetical protein